MANVTSLEHTGIGALSGALEVCIMQVRFLLTCTAKAFSMAPESLTSYPFPSGPHGLSFV